MALGCGSETTAFSWRQVQQADRDLATLRRLGVDETHPAYKEAWRTRGEALAKVGYKVTKTPAYVMDWATWSPVRIRLGYEPGYGFFIVAKEKPGALPSYKSVSVETAAVIIKEEVTPDLLKELLAPDEYIGE